jgi:predicted thioesterase
MDIDLDALRDRELTGRREFTVGREDVTTVFGEQERPPGRLAAADASPEEAVRVLGSPQLLAVCEFTGRESLRGHLPPGTGTVGESADLSHRRAAPLGTDLLVETTLDRVATPRLELTGTVRRAAGGVVGTVGMTFQVVERDRFRRAVDPDR